MTAPVSPPSGRVGEIDALRGIAAVLVMLFHYTTRYDDLYGHTSAPIFSVPWGHLGVNLFFMISGYVIYMTLERTRTVADSSFRASPASTRPSGPPSRSPSPSFPSWACRARRSPPSRQR